MAVNISNKSLTSQLNRYLSKARKRETDALAKIASGSRFAGSTVEPAERAIAESMEHRVRSLSASKKNINDAISLLQTAESSMAEINNIVTRMKEINIAAASTTVGDQERRFLFIEYDALYDEIERIATTTEFNGMPLLDGASDRTPERLIFRIDDPYIREGAFGDGDDLNAITFEGLKDISAVPEALGLNSAKDYLEDADEEEGIYLEDVEEMLLPEDPDLYATRYDQAITRLANQRAVFGSLQSRLEKAMDFVDVYQENIEAAKSKIADTDYANEVANMLQAKIASQAATALLAQNRISSQQTLQLINNI